MGPVSLSRGTCEDFVSYFRHYPRGISDSFLVGYSLHILCFWGGKSDINIHNMSCMRPNEHMTQSVADRSPVSLGGQNRAIFITHSLREVVSSNIEIQSVYTNRLYSKT